MVKAILFDFDGVLTLDETGSQSICNYISQITGIDKNLFQNEYKKYNDDLLIGKLQHEDIWQSICNSVGMQIKIDILYDSFINTPINSEMLAIVQKAKDIGLKTAMVTDNKADRIKSIVAYHHWSSLFDIIAVSAEIGSGKDHEEIFYSVFETLAVNPDECVFIDNKKENLIIPSNLGVKTIFFDHSKNDINKLKKELADII